MINGDFNMIYWAANKNNVRFDCHHMGQFHRFVNNDALKESHLQDSLLGVTSDCIRRWSALTGFLSPPSGMPCSLTTLSIRSPVCVRITHLSYPALRTTCRLKSDSILVAFGRIFLASRKWLRRPLFAR
jgi:hypothetical protein